MPPCKGKSLRPKHQLDGVPPKVAAIEGGRRTVWDDVEIWRSHPGGKGGSGVVIPNKKSKEKKRKQRRVQSRLKDQFRIPDQSGGYPGLDSITKMQQKRERQILGGGQGSRGRLTQPSHLAQLFLKEVVPATHFGGESGQCGLNNLPAPKKMEGKDLGENYPTQQHRTDKEPYRLPNPKRKDA